MIIGISGPSGSGKTTIARAICQALNRRDSKYKARVLHQDDFYKPEVDIPTIRTRAGDVVNWDCAQAIEMHALVETIKNYKIHGTFTASVTQELERRAKEDQNDRNDDKVTDLASQIFDALPRMKSDILIVDGFMLFHSTELLSTLDCAILLRGSFETLKARREARSGYVTLEGFWKDPEGYFEECVWPEYVQSHKQFFKDGDVEGEVISHKEVVISEEVDMNLRASMEFVVDALHSRI